VKSSEATTWLALPPIQVAVTARLTDGDMIEFEVPVPDVEAAFF
jgi:hypothetical protein